MKPEEQAKNAIKWIDVNDQLPKLWYPNGKMVEITQEDINETL